MNNFVKLSLPFDSDPPQFYCPACGSPLLGNFEQKICDHVVLITDPEGTDPFVSEMHSELYQEILEKEDKGEISDATVEFAESLEKESLLKYQIDFGGSSCGGGLYYSITAIIDYAP